MASTYQDKNTPQGTNASESLGSSLAGKVSTPQPSGANTPIAKAASSNNYINQVNDAMSSGVPKFNAAAYDSVTSAQNYLQNVIANKPGSYQSKYTGPLNKIYNDLLNRGPFEYNMNGDALYDQYKQRYTAQGQRSMRDTMGQAAAQTGGYGSSYAQTAGQDAYNNYMAQLQQAIPQLQAQAQQRYNDETTRMTNQYNLINSAEQTDYGRYRDQVGDYYNDLNYATNAENNAYNKAYGEWSDQVNMGMTAIGNQRQEEANDKNSAQALVSTMISAGAKPSKALMQQAGYSEKDVKALLKKK